MKKQQYKVLAFILEKTLRYYEKHELNNIILDNGFKFIKIWLAQYKKDKK